MKKVNIFFKLEYGLVESLSLFMNKFFIKVKCKFYKYSLEMPYEEVYFQRLEDDSDDKRKQKQYSKKF